MFSSDVLGAWLRERIERILIFFFENIGNLFEKIILGLILATKMYRLGVTGSWSACFTDGLPNPLVLVDFP